MRKLLLGIAAVLIAGSASAQQPNFGKVVANPAKKVVAKSTALSKALGLDDAKVANNKQQQKKMNTHLQWANAAQLSSNMKSVLMPSAATARHNVASVAADAPLTWWGYTVSSAGKVFPFGFDDLASAFNATFLKGQTKYNLACVIPANYAKAKIDSVEFVIKGTEQYKDLTVWVAPFSTISDEKGEYYNPPVSADEAAVKVVVPAADITAVGTGFGWIGVKLPTSFVVPEDGCFVGYSFESTSGATPVITWYTDDEEGGCIMQYEYQGDRYFDSFSGMGVGNLTTIVGMDVTDCDANSASVGADPEQTVMINEPADYYFYVYNNGAKAITNIDYTLTTDGEAIDAHLDLVNVIAPLSMGVIPLSGKAFDTDGVHTIELVVNKVNGNDNIATDNSATNSAIVLEKAAERVSVVEEMTGTWCGWCPRGHVALENMKKTFGDKVITLASHFTGGTNAVDPMNCYLYDQNDPFGNYGVVADQISQYLGGGGFPGAIFDRMIWADPYNGMNNQLNDKGTFDYGGDDLINAMRLAIPSEAELELAASWEDDAKTTIKVDLSTTFNYDRFGENPYGVGFILSENGMKGAGTSWMQLNYYSNSYGNAGAVYYKNADMLSWFNAEVFVPMTYNNVVVQAWRPLGDALFTNEEEIVKGQTYTSTVSLPISSDIIQDKDMLSLTAILVNLNSLGIVNATQVHLGAGAAGITDVQKDANSNVVERYNLNGMRMNAPQKGLNIVRLADGRCVKVAVK